MTIAYSRRINALLDRFGDEAELTGDFGRKLAAFAAAIVARTDAENGDEARSYAESLIATRQAHDVFQAFSLDALGDRAPVDLIVKLADNFSAIAHEETGWDATARKQIKLAVLFAVTRANDVLLTPAQEESLDKAGEVLDGLLASSFPGLRAWTKTQCRCGPLELNPYMRRMTVEPWLRAVDGASDPRAVEEATRRLALRLKRDFLGILNSFSAEQRVLIDLMARADAPVTLNGLVTDIDVRRTGKPGALFSLALLGLEQRRAVTKEKDHFSLIGADFIKWYRLASLIPDARVSKYVPRPSEPARDVA